LTCTAWIWKDSSVINERKTYQVFRIYFTMFSIWIDKIPICSEIRYFLIGTVYLNGVCWEISRWECNKTVYQNPLFTHIVSWQWTWFWAYLVICLSSVYHIIYICGSIWIHMHIIMEEKNHQQCRYWKHLLTTKSF
jgi:hypothetical protein